MDDQKIYLKYKKVRQLCLKNAEDLINAAKQVSNKKLQHIQYHLSTLALEEIGKGELIEMYSVAKLNHRDTSFEENSMENHVRKLYWAFWGPSFGKKVINKQEIEQLQGLATHIHLKRLDTLYVKPIDTKQPKLRLSQVEADEITSLAEARLGMEKTKTMLNPNDPSINKEELNWFLNSNSDPEKFKLIFGKKSQEKLVEIGNIRDWIHWLKDQFDQNDAEIKKIIDEEYQREKPQGEEAKKPKYKIKIRINSESHSIRKKNLQKWNKNSQGFINLDTDNKNDLICEFTFNKAIPLQKLFEIGWGISRTFVVAINVASKGFFWWHIPKDRSKYYEKMFDLERNMELGAEINPKLMLNWKDQHLVLTENELLRTNLVFFYLLKIRGTDEETPINSYARGLSFTAKNDIHLRFEYNAFYEFFEAFVLAFKINGDWDGIDSTFKDAVHKIYTKLGTFDSLDEIIELGFEQKNSPTRLTSKPITLTEIFALKIYLDVYIEILAKRKLKPDKQ